MLGDRTNRWISANILKKIPIVGNIITVGYNFVLDDKISFLFLHYKTLFYDLFKLTILETVVHFVFKCFIEKRKSATTVNKSKDETMVDSVSLAY